MKAIRMMLRGLQVGLVFLAAVVVVHAETTEPSGVPPEICDLVVTGLPDTGDVVVSWSGGTQPFVVVRSDTEGQALRLPGRRWSRLAVGGHDGHDPGEHEAWPSNRTLQRSR